MSNSFENRQVLFTHELSKPLEIYIEGGEIKKIDKIEFLEPSIGNIMSVNEDLLGLFKEEEYGELLQATRQNIIDNMDNGGATDNIVITLMKGISDPRFGQIDARLNQAIHGLYFGQNTFNKGDKRTCVKDADSALYLQAQDGINIPQSDLYAIKKKLKDIYLRMA